MKPTGIEQWKAESEKPSYLWEMLTAQGNIYAGLSVTALGAVLSIPFGFGVGLIPLVCFAAADAIAAMFVPNSMTFRRSVDLKHRCARRELARRHLLRELDTRLPDGAPEFSAYHRMLERIESLRTIASSRGSSMGESDVERLDDACVDFLALFLAKTLVEERQAAMDVEALGERRESIRAELEASHHGTDRRTLQKALDNLETLGERHRRLEHRKTAIETAVLSMPDTLEELYHNMITNPNASKAADYLQSAVDRLRLEEELDYAVASEVEAIAPISAGMAASSMLNKARG